jgi:transposase-like protein
MRNHTFSGDEIEKLKKNPFVRKFTNKSITYTPEFKKQAIEQHNQGMSYKDIFRSIGINLNGWNAYYAKDCLKRWKKILRKKGAEGLSALQGSKGGRPKTKGITDADKIKRLELQIRYLQAENDFLAKLRAKRAESNSGQIRNSKSSGN